MAFIEAAQTVEEVAAIPRLVAGPCLLNVVRRGKTPELDLREAERMGYRLAIVPGLLFKAAIGACEVALAALTAEHRHPVLRPDLTVGDVFERMGARGWDVLRTRGQGNSGLR
jgi:2-methylisocitrate lyase-like PEP mutase family enzyme